MNLEPVIQSEASLKEKNKYHILMHIYIESRKNGFDESVGREGMETQTLYGHSWGRIEWAQQGKERVG